MQEAWSWWPPRNGILSRIMNDTCACMAEIDTLSTSNDKTANESEAYTSNADPTTMLAVVLVIVRDQFRAKFERKWSTMAGIRTRDFQAQFWKRVHNIRKHARQSKQPFTLPAAV